MPNRFDTPPTVAEMIAECEARAYHDLAEACYDLTDAQQDAQSDAALRFAEARMQLIEAHRILTDAGFEVV